MSNDTQDITTRIVPTPWGDFEVRAYVSREPYQIGGDFELSAYAQVADRGRFANGYEHPITGDMRDPIIINGKRYPASTRFSVTARGLVWADTYGVELTESARRQLSEHLGPAAGELLESAEVRAALIAEWVERQAEWAARELERAREDAERRVQRARDLAENAPKR